MSKDIPNLLLTCQYSAGGGRWKVPGFSGHPAQLHSPGDDDNDDDNYDDNSFDDCYYQGSYKADGVSWSVMEWSP